MAIAFGAVIGEVHTTGGGTSKALTTTASVPSGGKAILAVSWYNTVNLSSVSGGSLTWTVDKQYDGTAGYRIAIVSADAPSGLASGTAITANFSGFEDTCGILGCYITGAETTSFVDVSDGAAASSGTSVAVNLTTTNADDLIISALWVDFLGANDITPAAGFTEYYDILHADSQKLEASYQVVSATGTYTGGGSWTFSNANVAVAVAYKAAAGGGADSPIDPRWDYRSSILRR